MSDLQCPATLLIACPGDADPSPGSVLSDDRGVLTDKGRAQVSDLAERLRSRRIAAVYSSQTERAIESGELAATELGVQALAVEGMQEFPSGELAGFGHQDPGAQQVFDAWLRGDLGAACPGAEDGHVVVELFAEALEKIADTHRGETVLVFTHGDVMSLVIPRFSVNVRNDYAAQRFLSNCVPVEIEVDADGWRLVSWPGTAAGQ